MTILGIDPGTATLGYGVITARTHKLGIVTCGALTTPATMPEPTRLRTLYDGLLKLIGEHRPQSVSVEQLFFNRNVRSAFAVGQARGVALLAAANTNTAVAEYTPLQVKQALTGHGRAEKAQVGFMVRALLGLPSVPRPDDAADALAIAICHAHSHRSRSRMEAALAREGGR